MGIIVKKCRLLRQRLCRHRFQEGKLSHGYTLPFAAGTWDAYTTVCSSCGKELGIRFVPGRDGS